MLGRLLRMFAAPADPPAERRPVAPEPPEPPAAEWPSEESPSDESPGADSPAAESATEGPSTADAPAADAPAADPSAADPSAADPPEAASDVWSEILVGVEEPALEPEPVEEAHGEPPAPQPAAAAGAELALAVSIMRAAPDVRYRAARSLGLFDGLDGRFGVELERALLVNARRAGKLEALEEALAQ